MLLLLSIVKKNSKVSGSYGMEGENNDPICPERSTPSKRNKAIYKVHKKQKKAMETRIYTFNSVTHWFLKELSQ